MSLQQWTRTMDGLKSQMEGLKVGKSQAIKQLDSVISAQTDSNRKKEYREKKAQQKVIWDSKIKQLKSVIDGHKKSKPAKK